MFPETVNEMNCTYVYHMNIVCVCRQIHMYIHIENIHIYLFTNLLIYCYVIVLQIVNNHGCLFRATEKLL